MSSASPRHPALQIPSYPLYLLLHPAHAAVLRAGSAAPKPPRPDRVAGALQQNCRWTPGAAVCEAGRRP